MSRKISIVNDLCYIIMEILLMSVTYLLAQALIDKNHVMHYLGILIICVIAFFDYVLKLKCENFIVYLSGHIIFIPIILYSGINDIETVTMIVLLVLQLLGSIQYWQIEVITERKKQLHITLFAVVVFIGVELACEFMNFNTLFNISAIMGVTFLILYFIRNYLTNMLELFTLNVEARNTPFHKIFLMNSGFNGIILLFSVMLIVLIYLLKAGNLLIYVWYGIKYLFTAVLRLFHHVGSSGKTIVPESFNTPITLPDFLLNTTPVSSNPVLNLIFKLLSFGLFIASVILVINVIYKSLKFYMKRYTPKTGIVEYTESININKKEKSHSKNPLTSLFLRKTNNQKIRKIYYNKIKYYQKSLVDVNYYDTPGEIKERIKTKTDYSLNTLTDIYEKARYGEKELDKEYVEKAKKAKE